jgi:4-hydroxy-3-methylbut-2-enyl diphosphate reductase
MQPSYFRKGFGLKAAIAPQLTSDYHSSIIEQFKENHYRLDLGDLTIRLAREFGFCYGVDRAVEYAYEARTKFPDRRLFLVGEIIHNPHVNEKLSSMGVVFLTHSTGGEFDFDGLAPEDVVILPAFGVTVRDFHRLREIGCVMVDTTCGSVLNVWKRVDSYARDGFTAVIHGKHWHEETKATASQVTRYPDGKYLILLDRREADEVMNFLEFGGDPPALAERFRDSTSPGFDFSRDLTRIGFANQTTMLAGESLAMAEAFRALMERLHGPEAAASHVRTFDTICSATQERQDAVLAMLEDPIDAMLVIGGYNSSNTNHLAALCRSHGVVTYHIEDASCIEPETGSIRHRIPSPPDTSGAHRMETTTPDWLVGVRVLGVTAGASTPNNKIGEAVERIRLSLGE